jgi:enoyl-CoA hydratase
MIMRAFYDYFLSIRTLRMPVVAAINGHAIGAGVCISLFADMRVAAEDAKMGFNFVNLGLHPVRAGQSCQLKKRRWHVLTFWR